uniref:Putative hippocampus abundant transcript-like protein 1 n=1 Tax=Davidia involucrata TaxID=16924 RepID=A0A5B6YGE7_DAVIN
MEKLAGLSHIFVTVFLSNFAAIMVIPAITDVTMSAVCPGKDECSLAIYLSGFQQAIVGLGTVVMMPLIGNLSDVYGRKALLTLPLTISIIPLVVLAYSRTTSFFYVYFAFRTLTAMVSEGSVQCLALAYVADNVSERQRGSAIGVLSGIGSSAFVCGTLASRFLSPARIFQVAAIVSMIAAVYMRVFLKDTACDDVALTRPILKTDPETIPPDGKSSRRVQVFKKIPLPKDLMCLLKSSVTFSQVAFVAFFNSLAEGGLQASLLYFLRARFNFNKDQFADLLLILSIAGTISQLLFMPMLAPAIGEGKLLSIGLFVGFSNMLLNSIAWSVWVPYVVAVCGMFAVFSTPCLRSIVSKQAGPNEQGMVQGCISGISSFANIISPLIFSPLTALFLSEKAPFHFPGFSILCIGLVSMVAFIQSIMIRVSPPTSSNNVSDNDCTEA